MPAKRKPPGYWAAVTRVIGEAVSKAPGTKRKESETMPMAKEDAPVRYLSARKLASVLGLKTKLLHKWRRAGIGPVWVLNGTEPAYAIDAVQWWLDHGDVAGADQMRERLAAFVADEKAQVAKMAKLFAKVTSSAAAMGLSTPQI